MRKWFDAIVNLIVVALVGAAIYSNVRTFVSAPSAWCVLGALFYGFYFVLFLIRRPSTRASSNPVHYVCTLGGTYAPVCLQFRECEAEPLVLFLTLPLLLLGISITFVSLACLGRSFGVVAAQREIKTRGIYRIIRHPLYTGEGLWFLAMVLQNFSWYNAGLFTIGMLCQWMRIREEERLLGADPTYCAYRDRVSYCCIPGWF